MSIFRVEDGKFSRSGRVIFDNLNFSINKGEALAILGCNGVGKTTLIQCCIGLLKWQSGKSYINNRSICSFKNNELFSHIAYIPQAKNLNIGLKVIDMVLLGCNTSIKFIPKKEHKDRALATLSSLGIEYLANKSCDNLSGGELQMVVFARALVNNPSIIILDEPESNLDFKNQHIILETLQRLKVQNKAIIINTHYPQNAKKLAEKVLIMHKDKKHILGDNSLINKTQLSKSFNVSNSFFDYLGEIH